MPYHASHSAPLVRIRDLMTIHYYEIPPDYRFSGESHPFWEIVYVDDGEVDARNGDDRWHAAAGELLFHAPDTFHLVQGDGRHLGHVFIISFTCRSPAMERFRDLRLPLPQRLRTLVAGIIHEATAAYDMELDGLFPLPGAPRGANQLICLYLEQLLIVLYRQLTGPAAAVPGHDLPGEVILYLNSRVYGTLSIPQLCRHMYYGRTMLSRQFREATGQTIMQYYRQLKINEAKRLLRAGGHTVAEIASLLCYDTPQYFSQAFKKATGMTPGEYRASLAP